MKCRRDWVDVVCVCAFTGHVDLCGHIRVTNSISTLCVEVVSRVSDRNGKYSARKFMDVISAIACIVCVFNSIAFIVFIEEFDSRFVHLF